MILCIAKHQTRTEVADVKTPLNLDPGDRSCGHPAWKAESEQQAVCHASVRMRYQHSFNFLFCRDVCVSNSASPPASTVSPPAAHPGQPQYRQRGCAGHRLDGRLRAHLQTVRVGRGHAPRRLPHILERRGQVS